MDIIVSIMIQSNKKVKKNENNYKYFYTCKAINYKIYVNILYIIKEIIERRDKKIKK